MTSGRLNPLVADQAPPPVPAVQQWARAYDGRHGRLVDLSQAAPGYPPHPDLLAWLAQAAGAAALAGYGPIQGEPVLREAYAAHLAALYGADLAAGHVHVTAGCNQAFFATALALAGPGQRVVMTDPGYFNHATTLAMLGIGVDRLALDPASGFLPAPQQVDAALAAGARALALVTPNNPTGTVYPPDLLAEIFDICRRRGAWLILDETYRDFLPERAARPHDLFARRGWEQTLVQLYSFSKSFCIPGHRLGAVTAAPALIAEVAKVMDNLQICAPRAAQVAVARALGPLAGWREANRLEIMARATALRQALAALPGWELRAMGAYFAFVRHPLAVGQSIDAARQIAAEAGVLVIPGDFFGAAGAGHLRFAFANADVGTIRLLPDRLSHLA